MAINIVEAGFDLIVYDIRDEPLRELSKLGATVARSAKEAAEYADLIEIAVLDDKQVEAALFGDAGVFAGATPGTMVAVHSTVLPKTLRKIAERAAERNLFIVDAPISGGVTGAYEKRLCYMVGGAKESVDRCREVFATSGAEFCISAT
jgi:3-hydroxyisobutyrate dehydrogenase-like beta-hydroxyacid dehydrogenase